MAWEQRSHLPGAALSRAVHGGDDDVYTLYTRFYAAVSQTASRPLAMAVAYFLLGGAQDDGKNTATPTHSPAVELAHGPHLV